jgi:hypothetical protein
MNLNLSEEEIEFLKSKTGLKKTQILNAYKDFKVRVFFLLFFRCFICLSAILISKY